MKKEHLAIEICQIVGIHCKVVSNQKLLAKSCNFEVNTQIACHIMMTLTLVSSLLKLVFKRCVNKQKSVYQSVS